VVWSDGTFGVETKKTFSPFTPNGKLPVMGVFSSFLPLLHQKFVSGQLPFFTPLLLFSPHGLDIRSKSRRYQIRCVFCCLFTSSSSVYMELFIGAVVFREIEFPKKLLTVCLKGLKTHGSTLCALKMGRGLVDF